MDALAGCSAAARQFVAELRHDVEDHELQLRRARGCIRVLASALAEGSTISDVDLEPCNRFVAPADPQDSATESTDSSANSGVPSTAGLTDRLETPRSNGNAVDETDLQARAAAALEL